jgi:hypothetical protein
MLDNGAPMTAEALAEVYRFIAAVLETTAKQQEAVGRMLKFLDGERPRPALVCHEGGGKGRRSKRPLAGPHAVA